MKRIRTGIRGFDELIQGGIPETFSLLVCGTPGTGKSIFGLEYIYHGAKDFGDNGLYVTIEERPEKLRDQAIQFGMDIVSIEKMGKIYFLKIPIDVHGFDIIGNIMNVATKMKAKRIVIDSLSILDINAGMYQMPITMLPEGDRHYTNSRSDLRDMKGDLVKQFIYFFVSRLSSLGATTIFIADAIEGQGYLTRDTVSEFVCDGIVKLEVKEFGNTLQRTIEVKKLRNTALSPGLYTLKVDNKGLSVEPFNY
ncbi:MAG: ATPase domain-containing protein [Candidatus Woesearchaeota archaeon]